MLNAFFCAQMDGLLQFDKFCVAHVLACLDHASMRALSMASRALAQSAVREQFLQRSRVRVPMEPPTAAKSDSASLQAAAGSAPFAQLAVLLARPEITQLAVPFSIHNTSWYEELTKRCPRIVAAKITAVAFVPDTRSHYQARAADTDADDYRARILGRNVRPRRAMCATKWLKFARLMPNLTKLDLGTAEVSSLEWIQALTNLDTLQLDASRLAVKSLESLSHLHALATFCVFNYSGQNLEFLAHMPQLKSLMLVNCSSLWDLSGLCLLKQQLETLQLSDLAAANDLSPVLELSALRELDVTFLGNYENVRSAAPSRSTAAAAVPRLEKASFHATHLGSVDFVLQFPRLRELTLLTTEVANWDPLSSLTELEYLAITVDSAADLSPLERLTKLRHLQLSSVRDELPSEILPALANLETLFVPAFDVYESMCLRQRSLERLHLTRCRQQDIDRLAVCSALPSLTNLTLIFPPLGWNSDATSSTAVDLSGLQWLTQLRRLRLLEADIEDLQPLAPLTKLEFLEISVRRQQRHAIRDFASLSTLVGLKSLSVHGRREFTGNDLVRLTTHLQNLRWLDSTHTSV